MLKNNVHPFNWVQVHYTEFVNSVVQTFCVLTYFLFISSINF